MLDRLQIDDIDGEVKWFDERKGFGFIIGPARQDIFIHFTVIEGEGFRVLKDGARVRYSAVRGEKGWKATRVTLLEEPEKDETVAGGEGMILVVPRKAYSRTPRR